MTRAQLLRGGWGSNRQKVIRAPWTKAEELFVEMCNRCGACIDACPQQILKPGSGKFPVVDFTDVGCDFCQKCVDACKYDAFIHTLEKPWGNKVNIRDNCLSKIGVICQSCSEVCEHDVIEFKLEMGGVPSIGLNLKNCNGCGECVSICPKDAIKVE